MIHNNKKMIKYEYQVIRYVHDIVTEEFVNVGIIFYAPSVKILKSERIKRFARISRFFLNVEGYEILRVLNHINRAVKNIEKKIEDFNLFVNDYSNSISNITNRLIPKDDSSIQLSNIYRGITLNPEITFSELFSRFILQYEEIKEKSRSDQDAWRHVYKKYFDQHGISKIIRPHTIKTENDNFEFEHCVKNGSLYCYQPISFDLLHSTDIKDKAYRWAGKLDELTTAKEDIDLYMLTISSSNPKLREAVTFAENKLRISNGKLSVHLVREQSVEQFIEKQQSQLEILLKN